MSRLCPDDGTALERRAYDALLLDVCPVCAGVYFDEGELGSLQDAGAEALERVEDAALPSGPTIFEGVAPKRCPGCGGRMRGYNYRYSSDIRVDGCEGCGGLWAQDGELAKVAAHLRDDPSFHPATLHARREAESRNALVRLALTLHPGR